MYSVEVGWQVTRFLESSPVFVFCLNETVRVENARLRM